MWMMMIFDDCLMMMTDAGIGNLGLLTLKVDWMMIWRVWDCSVDWLWHSDDDDLYFHMSVLFVLMWVWMCNECWNDVCCVYELDDELSMRWIMMDLMREWWDVEFDAYVICALCVCDLFFDDCWLLSVSLDCDLCHTDSCFDGIFDVRPVEWVCIYRTDNLTDDDWWWLFIVMTILFCYIVWWVVYGVCCWTDEFSLWVWVFWPGMYY